MTTTASNLPIQNMLMRMAFSDDSAASFAVMYAVLALASYHLLDGALGNDYHDRAGKAIVLAAKQRRDVSAALQCVVAAVVLGVVPVVVVVAVVTVSLPRVLSLEF